MIRENSWLKLFVLFVYIKIPPVFVYDVSIIVIFNQLGVFSIPLRARKHVLVKEMSNHVRSAARRRTAPVFGRPLRRQRVNFRFGQSLLCHILILPQR